MISREAVNTNIFIVFDLIQIGIKTWIYHIQDEHANHYTIDAVLYVDGLWFLTPLPTIFQLNCICQFYWLKKP